MASLIIPAGHGLAQIQPISEEEMVREDNEIRSGLLDLLKSPPLELPPKAIKLGLAEEFWKYILYEICLIDDAE